MRIISGQYKGKKIYAGKDHSIRPITNKIKEIIFAVLGDFCKDKDVVDLFCGSGSLGIEALSRGAARVSFIEKTESSIKILRNNIHLLQIDPSKIHIIKDDALNFASKLNSNFKLILIDPPFRYSLLQILIDNIVKRGILHQDGILVLHHEIINPLRSDVDYYRIMKQKKVGRSLITFISIGDKNGE
jgi:16S rRNA (guanine(966)-N(2))-methyltransferase RsmD